MFMRGFAVLLLAIGLSGCAAPVRVPDNAQLMLLSTPVSISNEWISDGTLYVVEDANGKVVAVVPVRKNVTVSVNGLNYDKRYRFYLVPL